MEEKRRPQMFKTWILLALIVVISAGCATQQQFLQNKQDMAVQTVLSRAQFEMNCPEATPVIISKEVVQPAIQGPWANGIWRAEYTIGVTGCGKRATFVVICPQGGEGCYSTGSGPFHNWQQ
jgi:uncharacterized protein (DUF2147 family)